MNGKALGLLLPLAGAIAAGPAEAQFGLSGESSESEAPHATMRLATETERLTPGEHEIAVVFTIDDEWHLYWKNPGDTGLAPDVRLELPGGMRSAGEARWPAPKRYVHGRGALLDYIYEGEVALLFPVIVSEGLVGETATIKASASWLVCKEACLPGEGSDELRVSVGTSPGAETDAAAAIRSSRARVPIAEQETLIESEWEGLTLAIRAPGADRMELFPLMPQLGGPANAIRDGVAEGDTMRVVYDPRVREAVAVAVVVGITRENHTEYVRVTAIPPAE